MIESTPAVPLSGGNRLALPAVEPSGPSKQEPQVPADSSVTPVYSTLRNHFTIERIEVELFTGDSELVINLLLSNLICS